MKLYIGVRNETKPRVFYTDSQDLKMTEHDLKNEGVEGFDWGEASEGASQLSFSLLSDVLNDRKRALTLYHSFKEKIIDFPKTMFVISDKEIMNFVHSIENKGEI